MARQDTQGEQCKTGQKQDIIVQDKSRTGYKTEQDLTDGVSNKQSCIQLINNEGKTSTTMDIKTEIM